MHNTTITFSTIILTNLLKNLNLNTYIANRIPYTFVLEDLPINYTDEIDNEYENCVGKCKDDCS